MVKSCNITLLLGALACVTPAMDQSVRVGYSVAESLLLSEVLLG